jgi:hypothetical protein
MKSFLNMAMHFLQDKQKFWKQYFSSIVRFFCQCLYSVNCVIFIVHVDIGLNASLMMLTMLVSQVHLLLIILLVSGRSGPKPVRPQVVLAQVVLTQVDSALL